MKSALSLVLIVALASPLPVVAQDRINPTAGPTRRAIAPEFARAVLPQTHPVTLDWSHVRKLAAGTLILVTLSGSQAPLRGYVVRTTEGELTVLNVADPPVPLAAAAPLHDLIGRHPECFDGTKTCGPLVRGPVRIRPDGVFIGAQKIAELAQLLETVARTQVNEVRTPVDGVNWGVLGAWLGVAAGVIVFLVACPGGKCGG